MPKENEQTKPCQTRILYPMITSFINIGKIRTISEEGRLRELVPCRSVLQEKHKKNSLKWKDGSTERIKNGKYVVNMNVYI